ncbi:hypothetical protein ACHAXT_008474 [Thalassiosira profunda]
MTNEEEATEEATPEVASASTDETAVTAKDDASTSASDDSKGKGFRWILLPTLLAKFTIVLCVKFATDVVVYPLLWLYRLARRGKRKVVSGVRGLFGGKDGRVDVKVNGDSSSSAESA